MTRRELAEQAAAAINAADGRLGAAVRAKGDKVAVVCQVGRSRVEIDFPPLGKPFIPDHHYSKLMVVKTARDLIDGMPASED